MDNTVYTVGIVGAGRIACGFDNPTSEHVLTHAHAVFNNPRLQLVAITDTDSAKGMREAKKWRTNFAPTTEELCTLYSPDIVVIATPDSTHADVLIEVLGHHPKLILLEKPAITEPSDITRIEEAVRAAGVPIIVNFRRRFDETVTSIARDFMAGTYGATLSAHALYSKGVIHTGSHLFDLTRLLFGEMLTSTRLAEVYDWEGEPTVSGFATFERCPQFSLMAGDERAYSLFELTILTEKRRFRFRDEGLVLETEEVIDDPIYPGFRTLGPAERSPTGLKDSMSVLAQHVVAVLDGNEESVSTLAEALKTDAACRAFL